MSGSIHLNRFSRSYLATSGHKARGRRSEARAAWAVNRRRWRKVALRGFACASLCLTSSTLLAELTTVELSPLIYRSTLLAPVDGNKQIGVVLALPSSDAAGLAAFVKHVSTPGDPLFRQYLTPQQFAQRFGGNEADYAALKSWAAANGLIVSQESLARTNLTVRGNASQFETLFQTKLYTYQTSDGQTFYSAAVKPTVPAEIASKVSGVIGLTAGKPLAQQAKIAKVMGENPQVRSDKMRADAGGTGPGGTYSCTDLRTAYSTPTWGNLEKGMIVAVFEQGSYHPTDVKKYFEKFDIGKNTKQTVISVDQSPISAEPSIEPECCLDIDMLVGMNPYIAEVKVFVDDFQYDPFSVAMVDAFQAMADDGTMQIVSVSYGEDEGYFGSSAENAEDTALQQLASEGITVFASAGDYGAFGDEYSYPYNVSDPCADPYVTGVGGTTLVTGFHEAYRSEVVWNNLLNYGATGGGVSTFWPIPDWQVFQILASFQGASLTNRNVPDVSAVADPTTGVGIYVKDDGGWIQIGGTSLSCPLWAGYLSNVNAALKWYGLGNIGFFNPMLDNLPTLPQTYDIMNGSNGLAEWEPGGLPGYYAGEGYDNCTGLGSMWGGFGIQLLVSQSQPGTAPGPITVAIPKPEPTSVKVNWTASSGTKGYIVALYVSGWIGPFPLNYGLGQVSLLSPDVTNLTFQHLTPETGYIITVYAFNASGGTSNYVTFETPKR
jgi:subtilase family serine protease